MMADNPLAGAITSTASLSASSLQVEDAFSITILNGYLDEMKVVPFVSQCLYNDEEVLASMKSFPYSIRKRTRFLSLVRRGDVASVAYLIRAGADVNYADSDMTSALQIALNQKLSRTTTTTTTTTNPTKTMNNDNFNNNKEEVVVEDNKGEMQEAAKQKREKMVELLLLSGANRCGRYDRGYTSLIYAVKEGLESMSLSLLSKVGLKEEGEEEKKKKKEDGVGKWSGAGAGAGRGSGSGTSSTSSHHHSFGTDIDIHARDKNGNTALIWAVYVGLISVISRLLELGADINVYDNFGNTPLSIAIEKENEAVLQLLLLNTSIDIHAKNPISGGTPLLVAAKYGSLALCRYLIEKQGGGGGGGAMDMSSVRMKDGQNVLQIFAQRKSRKRSKSDNSTSSVASTTTTTTTTSTTTTSSKREDTNDDDTIERGEVFRLLVSKCTGLHRPNVTPSGDDATTTTTTTTTSSSSNNAVAIEESTLHGSSSSNATTTDASAAAALFPVVITAIKHKNLFIARICVDEFGASVNPPLPTPPVVIDAGAGAVAVDAGAMYSRTDCDTPLLMACCTALNYRHSSSNTSSSSSSSSPSSPSSPRILSQEEAFCILLIDKGADVNVVDKQSGKTPLHYAASNGLEEVGLRLLAAGANVHVVPVTPVDGKTNPYGQKVGGAGAGEKDSSPPTTPLVLAVSSGLPSLCMALLDKGADVFTPRGSCGRSVLMLAATSTGVVSGMDHVCLRILQLVVQNPSSLAQVREEKSVQGYSLLHAVIASGHELTCDELLKPSCRFYFPTSNPSAATKREVINSTTGGNTALGLAAYLGHTNICKILIERGINVHARGTGAVSPLHMAAEGGHVETCTFLLKRGKADPNEKAREGVTPLMVAAQKLHGDVCEVLLQHGADIHIKDNITSSSSSSSSSSSNVGGGKSAISYAMNWRSSSGSRAADGYKTARILLDHGADVNDTDCFGHTPLLRLITSNIGRLENRRVLELLLERGANVNVMDVTGWTPLKRAAETNDEHTVRLLLEKGASVSDAVATATEAPVQKQQPSPLLLAIDNRNDTMCGMLLDYGADVNVRDTTMNTPLMKAAYKRMDVTCIILIEKGNADVNAKSTANGKTALMLAAQEGSESTCRALINASSSRVSNNSPSSTTFSTTTTTTTTTTRESTPQGIDIDATDDEGNSALALALKNKHSNVISYLRSLGAKEPK